MVFLNLTACVILYNPSISIINNLNTYVDVVERLYVIDNSEIYNHALINIIKAKKNVKYIAMNGNMGIASALNVALRWASEDSADYLLTMDQDSSFQNGVLEEYFSISQSVFSSCEKVAICGIRNKEDLYENEIEYVSEVITSGMIIKLSILQNQVFFEEKLFIDYVDYEFCYRLSRMGYFIVQINAVRLTHQIGGVNPTAFLGIHFNNHNEHSKVRYYYEARNALYVLKMYPRSWKQKLEYFFKTLVKLILVEDDKLGKFKYMCMGIYDSIRNKYGKYTEERD